MALRLTFSPEQYCRNGATNTKFYKMPNAKTLSGGKSRLAGFSKYFYNPVIYTKYCLISAQTKSDLENRYVKTYFA